MSLRALLSVLGLIVVLACPSHVFAQEAPDDPPTTPPGYDDPEDVTDITRYRLPTWTFTTVTLDLDGGTDRSRATTDGAFGSSPDREETVTGYDFATSPRLLTFTESEDRQFQLVISSDLDLAGNSLTEEGGSTQNRERSASEIGTALNIEIDWNEYVNDELFLTARSDLLGDYDRMQMDVDVAGVPVEDRTDTSVRYRSSTRLGVGFGRIRDVTPVFRALRVRERLNRLGRDNVMSAGDVQAAAQQFARRPGYNAIYDRPDKYFWNDLFSRAEDAGADLQPFEVFYVAEALQEPIARRFEGYEVTAGVNLQYRNQLQKTDADFAPDGRNRILSHRYGPFLRAEYVTNLNLRQQVGLTGDAQFAIPTDDDAIFDNVTSTRASARWLWEIADRYRLNTTARASYRRQHRNSTDTQDAVTANDWTTRLNSNLTVFLENRLAVTAGGGVLYARSSVDEGGFPSASDSSQSSLFLNVSVRYFLFRNLSI